MFDIDTSLSVLFLKIKWVSEDFQKGLLWLQCCIITSFSENCSQHWNMTNNVQFSQHFTSGCRSGVYEEFLSGNLCRTF